MGMLGGLTRALHALIDHTGITGVPAAGSAVDPSDLLTGDDRDFNASLGNWTNSGGTLSRTTATYIVSGYSAGSLKHATTDVNQYVEVPVSGTFKSGQTYWGVIFIGIEETSGAFAADLTLGLHGTDVGTQDIDLTLDADYIQYVTAGRYVVFAVSWTPTADRTGVTLRLTRENSSANGTKTPHIYSARVFQSPHVPLMKGIGTSASESIIIPMCGDSERWKLSFGGNLSMLQMLASGNTYLATAGGSAWLDLFDVVGGVGQKGRLVVGSYHTAGDKTGDGIIETVGADALELYTAEKSSTAIQKYSSSDVDLELRDGSTKGWQVVDSAGTTTSRLSKLHHVLTGTADPTAGGGVAHPQPAMYLRDNAGVTELWLATGAGATAWAKQTSP